MNTQSKTNLPAIRLLVDSCHGQYMPQRFAINYDLENKFDSDGKWYGSDAFDLSTIEDGPDNPDYWEAWDNILSSTNFKQDGYTWHLHQDGDLWAYCVELMTEEEKRNFGFEE